MDRMAEKRRKKKAAYETSFSYFRKGHPVITMHGNSRICIENYQRLLTFSPTRMQISTAFGLLVICGSTLSIACFSPSEIIIAGKILALQFPGEERV